MNIIIKGKEYNLSMLENYCLDEILHAVAKYGKDRAKCLDWGTFGYTNERRAIFDKMWKTLYA